MFDFNKNALRVGIGLLALFVAYLAGIPVGSDLMATCVETVSELPLDAPAPLPGEASVSDLSPGQEDQ